MPKGHPIRIPRETINDDFVTIVHWHVKSGDAVTAKDPLLEIETSKAVIELEAEMDGYVQIIHQAGEQVPVGSEVGCLMSEPLGERPPVRGTLSIPVTSGEEHQRISRKARILIEEKGLDLENFRDLEVVKERDVISYLERQGKVFHSSTEEDLSVVSTSAVSSGKSNVKKDWGWWSEVRSSARDRKTNIVWLAWNYFFRNYFLGFLAKIAPYGMIIHVHRWRGVKIGKDCFVDPSVTLETAYPENITIGDDVRITVNAIIMTHIKGPRYLRETGLVPRLIKPVVLEDHCFIGVGAIVMPGVTVGKASVVGSGAVVVQNVPPYAMVTGNPAKVVKTFSHPKKKNPE